MQNNESTLGAQGEDKDKAKKMTRAEFIVAFDKMNAVLQENIAQARAIQADTQVSREKAQQLKAETRELLLKL